MASLVKQQVGLIESAQSEELRYESMIGESLVRVGRLAGEIEKGKKDCFVRMLGFIDGMSEENVRDKYLHGMSERSITFFGDKRRTVTNIVDECYEMER